MSEVARTANLPATPDNWCWIKLGEIAQINLGKMLSRKAFTDGLRQLPYLRNQNIRWFTMDFDDLKSMGFKEDEIERFRVQPNDLLVCEGGEPGRCAVYRGGVDSLMYQKALHRIRPHAALADPFFIQYFFARYISEGSVFPRQSETTIKHLPLEKIKTVPISLPPLGEQRRIVAKIEEVFSDLDAGVAALERAKANLKRYRAAVLKAAVEGRLTEQWRAEHPDVEPAHELLQRILTERRRKWEQDQLAKYKANGRKPRKNWKDKYKPPAEPDVSNLPFLPDGWCWVSTDSLFTFVTSGSRGWARHYSDEGAVFLRVGNLDHQSISLDLTNIQRVRPPDSAEARRTCLEPGDLLISVTADVGMVAVVPLQFEKSFANQHVAVARPVSAVHGPYLAWYLATEHGGQRQFRSLQRGATKQGLGLDDIRNVNVPLPPFDEQVEIANVIESQMSVAEEMGRAFSDSRIRSSHLRGSLLRRAFDGKLVPQDPSDEPADKLLASIRQDRELRSTSPKPRTRKARRPAKKKRV